MVSMFLMLMKSVAALTVPYCNPGRLGTPSASSVGGEICSIHCCCATDLALGLRLCLSYNCVNVN